MVVLLTYHEIPNSLRPLQFVTCWPSPPPQVMTEHNKPTGYDRVRQYEIGKKDYELAHLDEAFTSEHWIVRIFKVKKPANRAASMRKNNRACGAILPKKRALIASTQSM